MLDIRLNQSTIILKTNEKYNINHLKIRVIVKMRISPLFLVALLCTPSMQIISKYPYVIVMYVCMCVIYKCNIFNKGRVQLWVNIKIP